MSSLLPSSSNAKHDMTSEESLPSEGKGRDSVEGPYTLVDKYELVGAVPTRIMKPSSAESSFTCYAFSTKGDRFVTGEADGIIRLWKTSSYELVGTHSTGTGASISAINFYGQSSDVLVAVDKNGVLLTIYFEDNHRLHAASSPSSATVLNTREIQCEESESNHSHCLRNQFSQDGRILAHFRGDDDPESNVFTFTTADIYRIEETSSELECIQIPQHSDGFEFSVPVLSKNGRSLLICCYQRDDDIDDPEITQQPPCADIRVIPRIDHGVTNQRNIWLKGQRASWGLGGEYLLVWDWRKGKPTLLIYKTEEIERKGDRVKHLAKRTVDLGLFDFKAQMLKPKKGETSIKVLIYEVTEHQKKRLRRFFIWDATRNAVSTEVHLDMYNVKGLEKNRRTLTGKAVEHLIETGFQTRSTEAFYCRLVADVFPKFCTAKNGNWIGAFSWKQHSGGISSTATGVTAWRFRLPQNVKLDPFLLPIHVRFDPRENHFMIFADCGIFACRPDFLQAKSSEMTFSKSTRLADVSNPSDAEDADLLEKWAVLPNAALVRKQSIKVESLNRKTSIHTGRLHDTSFQKVIDVFKSADGSLTAMIAEDANKEMPRIVSISEIGRELQSGHGLQRRFPVMLPMTEEPFNPARVFIFGQTAQGQGKVVLLSDQEKPILMFCDHQLEQFTPVCLDLTKCLDIRVTEDRKQLLILDIDSVCFLDLEKQAVLHRVAYKVDFDRVMTDLSDAMHWRRDQSECEEGFHSERRISDKGTKVLLGWDTKNQRSIVVNPEMEQGECDVLIQQADRRVSDFCALSASGRSTAFVNVDYLSNGKITIGIFNEHSKKTVLHFHVSENLPLTLPKEQKIRVLSSVFYGMSKDESELVTVTVGLHQILPHPWRIDEKPRAFNIYEADDSLPTYDRLTLKRITSLEGTFRKLHAEHGVTAFNAPSSNGMTLFQKAFIEENWEVVESIKRLAEEYGSLLAIEWTSPYSEEMRCDLLAEALKTMSPAVVKKAVALINSPLVPFGTAATVMKKHFAELVKNHLDVVEEALKNNVLVTHACDLDVHVNFMDQKRRKGASDYMDTTDTFLDWKHDKDKDAMKENWKHKHKSTVKRMESGGNTSTTPASLKFVRIEDTAKTGMNGILRPLLLKRVPVHFFEFDVVKWVVLFKWFTIWRKKFLVNLAWYVAFLILFTVYASILSRTSELSDEPTSTKIWLCVLLGATVPFCLQMVIEECRQLRTYMRDARMYCQYKISSDARHRKGKLAGLMYYLRLEWNVVDMLSCILVVAFIAPLQIIAFFDKSFEDWLAAFVAIEAIIAYFKVWYFAQPFQHTGPLVRMIYTIFWDSSIFLGLAFIVMLGFAVGLPALFRHPSGDAEELDDVESSIKHFDSSIETLFYALLGNFNPQIFRSAGNLSRLATTIFVFYLLIQMILLLNLLIAIMGDTFGRVKGTEEAHLLKGRAQFIDSCEAELGETECKKIDDGIEKYLHVLMEVGSKSDERTGSEWSGNLERIGNQCREVVQRSETNVKSMMDEQNRSMSTMGDQLKELRKLLVVDPRETQKHSHLAQRMDIVESRMSTMESTITYSSERVDEVLELLKNLTKTAAAQD